MTLYRKRRVRLFCGYAHKSLRKRKTTTSTNNFPNTQPQTLSNLGLGFWVFFFRPLSQVWGNRCGLFVWFCFRSFEFFWKNSLVVSEVSLFQYFAFNWTHQINVLSRARLKSVCGGWEGCSLFLIVLATHPGPTPRDYQKRSWGCWESPQRSRVTFVSSKELCFPHAFLVNGPCSHWIFSWMVLTQFVKFMSFNSLLLVWTRRHSRASKGLLWNRPYFQQ